VKSRRGAGSVSLKQVFKAFLMGAALVWLIDKLYSAYLTEHIRGRRRTYSIEKDPFSFDVMVAFDVAAVLIIVGMTISALWRASRR
jgi:lipoprotein signal peptidase